MKTFITALIIFVTVISGIILNYIYIGNTMDYFINLAISFPNDASEINGNLHEDNNNFSKLINQWHKSEFFISITVGHKEAESVNQLLIQLSDYYTAGENGSYRAARSLLLSAFRQIKDEEGLSLAGIL